MMLKEWRESALHSPCGMARQPQAAIRFSCPAEKNSSVGLLRGTSSFRPVPST